MFPNLPERIIGLGELAENLWWSWHPEARMLFKRLSRQGWKESGHNPDKMLKDLPGNLLEWAAKDPSYLRHYDVVLSRFRRDTVEGSCPLLDQGGGGFIQPIAYFSAEYGLHHSLPFYAGGLGFLAGDFVKECSDLSVPLVAVGFMYPEGYLYQRIREDGWQEDRHEPVDRDAASISRVLNEKGEQVVVRVPLIDPPIYVAVWQVNVGRIPLYLIDTDIEGNDPDSRSISARLYIGDREQRLRQEIVLGIGGSEVLDTLGIRYSLLHLNEGHAAFALLERVREMVQGGAAHEEAVERVKKTSIFTTHTPVPAGHDVFPFQLMEKYFHAYWASLGLDREGFLRLGSHPKDRGGGFNMTALALRLSGYRNGVSKKHGEVTRRMWQGLWPELAEEDVPIDFVTNGIHVPTWIEPKMELLFDRYLGPEWLDDHDNPLIWELVEDIPDKELWETHYWLKIKLINAIRERSRQRWSKDGAGPSIVIAGGTMLDPSILTLGFARRFATYKRADLILYDIERLKRLLNDRWQPIQIIFAGKAHPADDPGKRILQKVYKAASNPEMGGRIAFFEDYGEQYAQYMVHGVDVWLNNPLPPMEASGTSGMKAALNGVPHLSILDGWWLEGYDGTNGWALGGEAQENSDQQDAEAIYRTLEEKIIPIYYRDSEDGVPHDWVRMMKNSIKTNGAKFSARRMVKEYIQEFYRKALGETGEGSETHESE
jgi:starch phosphorylase